MAIRWIAQAWDPFFFPDTIKKCVRKGGVLSTEYKVIFREENGLLANLEVEHGRLRKEMEKMIAQV